MKRRCIPLNKFIFRRKPSEKKEQSLLRLLLPSVLGFALCFVCLAATTWAWFVVSVTSGANTIQTASFDVVVSDGVGTVTMETDGSYELQPGTTYSVTMSKTGDATGYFDFEVNGTPYRTTAITANTPITITIENTGAASITCSFTSYWGTPDGTTVGNGQPVTFNAVLPPEIISITDGETIIVGEPPEEPTDESEQENQQQEEENPSDKQSPADDPENNGEGENTSTDTPTEGEQGDEQQPSEPSTPTEGEGEQPDVSGETTGGDISDDTTTGGETPTDTTTPTGGDVSTESVVTTDPTDPTAQSEGGAPADPAPTE